MSTAGLGGSYQNKTVAGINADDLSSQGSVAINGNYLYVVNVSIFIFSALEINTNKSYRPAPIQSQPSRLMIMILLKSNEWENQSSREVISLSLLRFQANLDKVFRSEFFMTRDIQD